MSINFNKVIDQLKREKLSPTDKSILKSEILEKIRKADQSPIVSPWANVFVAFRAHTVAFVAVMTIIFTGGGFAVVAEGALPGEALYSFKVNFNEGVRDAIALHPSQKAQWSAEKARRRLQEAESLSGQGRLSENLEADLQNRFLEHAGEARDAMASLQRQQNVVALMEAASSLESVLSAHKNLINSSDREAALVALDARSARTQKEFTQLKKEEEEIDALSLISGSEEETASSSASSSTEGIAGSILEQLDKSGFLQAIEDNLEIVSRERERAEETLSSASDGPLRNAAYRLERKADIRGKVTGNLYSRIKENLSEDNRKYAERELDLFAERMIEGRRALDQSDYSSAVTTFNQISRSMNSLEIFLNSLVTANKIKDKQARNEKVEEPEEESSVAGTATTAVEVLPVAEEAGLVEGGSEESPEPEVPASTSSSSTVSEGRAVSGLEGKLRQVLKGY